MLVLEPLLEKFTISTVDLKLVYTEQKGAKISVEVKSIDDIQNGIHENYLELDISFSLVAEIKCICVNFYKFNHNQYDILTKKDKYGKHYTHGFFEVVNSEYLKQVHKKYDPRNNLNLKHYIIAGYDSYVELIASQNWIEQIKI
ncbi:MAG: hypothetical protein FWF57_01565 [Defluviitaleaceae bacterium]|nr:hypothetical protein [Defluviitaleaceae bacterium]